MDAWIEIFFKAFWCGWAGFGFAVLFNTPRRVFLAVYSSGFIAGALKFSLLTFGFTGNGDGIIPASLLAASVVGFISVAIAHLRHVPPIIVSIPAVIALVPGSFAYRTMLGLIKFIHTTNADVLTQAVHNGAMTLFIILVISIGVTLPMLLFRIESVKTIRIFDKEQN